MRYVRRMFRFGIYSFAIFSFLALSFAAHTQDSKLHQVISTDGVMFNVTHDELLKALKQSVRPHFSSQTVSENSDGSFTVVEPRAEFNGKVYGISFTSDSSQVCKAYGFSKVVSFDSGNFLTFLKEFSLESSIALSPKAELTEISKVARIRSIRCN